MTLNTFAYMSAYLKIHFLKVELLGTSEGFDSYG